MTEIDPADYSKFLNEEVIDALFEFINETLNKSIANLPDNGIGCFCFPDIPFSDGNESNLYVEYQYQVTGPRNVKPIPIGTTIKTLLRFDQMNEEIRDRVKSIQSVINNYTRSN